MGCTASTAAGNAQSLETQQVTDAKITSATIDASCASFAIVVRQRGGEAPGVLGPLQKPIVKIPDTKSDLPGCTVAEFEQLQAAVEALAADAAFGDPYPLVKNVSMAAGQSGPGGIHVTFEAKDKGEAATADCLTRYANAKGSLRRAFPCGHISLSPIKRAPDLAEICKNQMPTVAPAGEYTEKAISTGAVMLYSGDRVLIRPGHSSGFEAVRATLTKESAATQLELELASAVPAANATPSGLKWKKVPTGSLGYTAKPFGGERLQQLLTKKGFGVSHVELTAAELKVAGNGSSPTHRSAVVTGPSTWVPSDTRVDVHKELEGVNMATRKKSPPDEAAPELPKVVALGKELEEAGLRVGDELMWVNQTELEGDLEQCMEALKDAAAGSVEIIARRPKEAKADVYPVEFHRGAN